MLKITRNNWWWPVLTQYAGQSFTIIL